MKSRGFCRDAGAARQLAQKADCQFFHSPGSTIPMEMLSSFIGASELSVEITRAGSMTDADL